MGRCRGADGHGKDSTVGATEKINLEVMQIYEAVREMLSYLRAEVCPVLVAGLDELKLAQFKR